ncbi:hypothetical protein VU01_12731, partial [Candidatus Electrothrix marina]
MHILSVFLEKYFFYFLTGIRKQVNQSFEILQLSFLQDKNP